MSKLDIEFFDASLVCARLEKRKLAAIKYLASKIETEEWAKVSECANELRNIETELSVWEKFRRGDDVLS